MAYLGGSSPVAPPWEGGGKKKIKKGTKGPKIILPRLRAQIVPSPKQKPSYAPDCWLWDVIYGPD